jgi:hypothetical protein
MQAKKGLTNSDDGKKGRIYFPFRKQINLSHLGVVVKIEG